MYHFGMKGKTIILAAGITLALSAYAGKDLSFDRQLTLEASRIDGLEVDAGAGHMEILGADVDLITVEATIESDKYSNMEELEEAFADHMEFELKRDQGFALLKAKNKDKLMSFKSPEISIHLTIKVPQSFDLIVDDGSGHIKISDIDGSVEVDDGSGHLELSNIKDEVEIDDGSGHIELSNIQSTVEIDDGSGNVIAKDITGDFTIDDGSGEIKLKQMGGNVNIEDGSGAINAKHIAGNFTVDDGSGSIDVTDLKGKFKLIDDTYNNDIFGIGRDDNQGLHQSISRSVNSDALLTLSVANDFTSTNIG